MIYEIAESRSSKFKLYIDYNIVLIGKKLAELGYNPEFLPGNMLDDQINVYLNSVRKTTKEKPIILITKDHDDFLKFKIRKYHIIGITNDRIDEIKCSNKIRNLLISNNNDQGFPDGFITYLQ